MRTTVLAAVAAATLAFALPALADSDSARDVSFPVAAGQRVRLEFPTGSLKIEPSDDARVHVHMTMRCEGDDAKCAERMKTIDVVSQSSASALRVKLEGWPPRWNPIGLHFDTIVKVPRERALEVSLGAGQLELRGHRNDIDVELGVGDATLTLGRADTRRVRLEVGVGDAHLRRGSETIGGEGFIGHVVDWDQGKGRSEIRVKVGVGKVDVDLE